MSQQFRLLLKAKISPTTSNPQIPTPPPQPQQINKTTPLRVSNNQIVVVAIVGVGIIGAGAGVGVGDGVVIPIKNQLILVKFAKAQITCTIDVINSVQDRR